MPSSIIVAVFEESFVPRANRSIRAEPRAVAAVHVGEVHIRGGGVRGGVFGEDEVGRVNGKIRIVPRCGRNGWEEMGVGVGGAVKRVATTAGRREGGGGRKRRRRGGEPLEKRSCGKHQI